MTTPAVIRGFTLWRPWLWCFTHAGKRIENRSWKPPATIIGGYLALHNGNKWDESAFLNMRQGEFGLAAKMVPDTIKHVAGQIEAVAYLSGYFRKGDMFEHEQESPYAFGPYCWRTPNVYRLDEPVPHRGAQGLWTLEDRALARIREQLPELGL